MSDTRSLSIVRDAAASAKRSTFIVTCSGYDGEVGPGGRALRAQQVHRLKRAVVSGEYQADPLRIAVKLLKRS
jgi:anti-sigma28 factor (negative regulator of flagellin synthesis)